MCDAITVPWWVVLSTFMFLVQFGLSWWFLCNIGNKHSTVTYWFPQSEFWFIFGTSIFLGFFLIPFLIYLRVTR